MNRTGLYIALAISVVFGLLFGLYPELDLKVAAFFYDATTKTFPLKSVTWAMIARDGAMWIAWGLVMPALVSLVVKLIRPVKPLMISGRAMVFLIVTMLLTAIVLSNIVFKGYWGRPRPVVVTEFNGPLEFKAWWGSARAHVRRTVRSSRRRRHRVLDLCARRADAAAVGVRWPMVAATAFGVFTGGLRMSFGGHFLTDVLFSGTWCRSS